MKLLEYIDNNDGNKCCLNLSVIKEFKPHIDKNKTIIILNNNQERIINISYKDFKQKMRELEPPKE